MKDYFNYSLNVTFYLRRGSSQDVEQAALAAPCIWLLEDEEICLYLVQRGDGPFNLSTSGKIRWGQEPVKLKWHPRPSSPHGNILRHIHMDTESNLFLCSSDAVKHTLTFAHKTHACCYPEHQNWVVGVASWSVFQGAADSERRLGLKKH